MMNCMWHNTSTHSIITRHQCKHCAPLTCVTYCLRPVDSHVTQLFMHACTRATVHPLSRPALAHSWAVSGTGQGKGCHIGRLLALSYVQLHVCARAGAVSVSMGGQFVAASVSGAWVMASLPAGAMHDICMHSDGAGGGQRIACFAGRAISSKLSYVVWIWRRMNSRLWTTVHLLHQHAWIRGNSQPASLGRFMKTSRKSAANSLLGHEPETSTRAQQL